MMLLSRLICNRLTEKGWFLLSICNRRMKWFPVKIPEIRRNRWAFFIGLKEENED